MLTSAAASRTYCCGIMKTFWYLAAVVLVAGAAVAVVVGSRSGPTPPTRISRGWSPIRLRPRRPDWAVKDFNAFLTRLRAYAGRRDSLLLHRDRPRAGRGHVPRARPECRLTCRLEMHAPFFTVDPEAIYALYADLPTLERGLALFQQN